MKRKILTSILALVLIVSMMPMSVLAAEESSSQTGEVISEGNPAEDIFRVVLPVTTPDTYDLTLDPYDLLSTSSLGGDRASYDGSSVYFGIASAPEVALTAGGTLYAATKKVSADVAGFDINDYFTVVDTAVTAIEADTLYVWAPQAGQEALGLGEYVVLTTDNYDDYFTLTLAETSVTGFTYAATEACDGLLYVSVGAAVSDTEAVGYCTVVSDEVTVVTGLYTEEALSTAAVAGNLTYTPSEVTHTKSATAVTAVNKSTYGVVLNVELNATNTTTPVTFTTTGAVEGDTALNLALDILGDDGSAVSNVVKNDADDDGTTNVDFYLSGTTANYSQYQGATDAATGGHSYNYLEKVAPTWSDIEFSIQGACNTTAEWADYNATLAADNRLALEVVYTMTSADDVVATPGDNYNATTGVITLTVPDVAPSTSDATWSLASSADLDITANLGSGASAATAITDVVVEVDGGTFFSIEGSFSSDTQYASYFAISGNTVTIDYTGWLETYPAGDYEVYIVFDDDETSYVLSTVTVTE